MAATATATVSTATEVAVKCSPIQTTALIMGASGRIGQLVTKELVSRGVPVRVLVRSPTRLPPNLAQNSLITVITAEVTKMSGAQWDEAVRGCDVVVCCLGHTLSFKGLFGPPFTLVRDATQAAMTAVARTLPAKPVKLVALNTGGSCNPDGSDNVSRGVAERAFIAALSSILPPWRDSILAANYIASLSASSTHVEWCVVRPEWFKEGNVSEYKLSATACSLFAEGGSTMANTAHFMADLVTQPQVWAEWRGKMPCIRDVPPTRPQAAADAGDEQKKGR